jgi:hypothetical protein
MCYWLTPSFNLNALTVYTTLVWNRLGNLHNWLLRDYLCSVLADPFQPSTLNALTSDYPENPALSSSDLSLLLS